MSKLSRIGGNQISEATALPGWKSLGTGSIANIFGRIISDKPVAMNFITELGLVKEGPMTWGSPGSSSISVTDYSEMEGKPHFSVMAKGAKDMKLADETLSKILNPHASEATVKAVAKLKKEIARIQNLANKERQMNMRVEYGSQLRKLNAELAVLETPKAVMVMRQEEAKAVLESRGRWEKSTGYGGLKIKKIITPDKAKILISALGMKSGDADNLSFRIPGYYHPQNPNFVGLFDMTQTDRAFQVIVNSQETQDKVDKIIEPPAMVMRQEEKIQRNGLTKWMLSEENKKWGMSKTYCYLNVNVEEVKRVISHFKMVSDDSHFFHTKEEPEAIGVSEGSPDRAYGDNRPSLEIYFTLWKGDLNSLKKFITEVNQVYNTKPPVMVMRQEEAMTADTVSKLSKKAGWRDFGDHVQKEVTKKTATILKAKFGGMPHLIDLVDTDYGPVIRVWYSHYKPVGMAWGDIEDIDDLIIKEKQPVMVMRQEENSTIDINTKNMSRLNRVFGQVETDPTNGFTEGAVDEQLLDPEDDLNLIQLEEEVRELPESLRKELLRSVQCDSTKVAMKTPHALITEGFVSVETSSITDITVREALSELGSPDFVFLKEGVYIEVLMVTPLLPMAESVASEKSRDWRQVSIEDVPHLYLKF